MKKLFILQGILGYLLLSFSGLTVAKNQHKIEFLLKNATRHSLFLKCGNEIYPGKWTGSRKFFIESKEGEEDPRKLQYECAIAIPNLGEKKTVSFGPSEFNFSGENSKVTLMVESVDIFSKCAKTTPLYRPAELIYSLSVDGQLIKIYEPICF